MIQRSCLPPAYWLGCVSTSSRPHWRPQLGVRRSSRGSHWKVFLHTLAWPRPITLGQSRLSSHTGVGRAWSRRRQMSIYSHCWTSSTRNMWVLPQAVCCCRSTNHLGHPQAQENLDRSDRSRLGNSERAAFDTEVAHDGMLQVQGPITHGTPRRQCRPCAASSRIRL